MSEREDVFPEHTQRIAPSKSRVGEVDLPLAAPGHWSTQDGWGVALRYATDTRADLAHGDLSDFDLANAVYMADRRDLSLIGYQTAAKERIRWLSVQLIIAREALESRHLEAAPNAQVGPGSSSDV